MIGTPVDPDTLVLTRGRDFEWTFQNLDESGDPTAFPPGDLFFELFTGGEHNCIQQIEVLNSDDGEYTLIYDGVESEPIEFYDTIDTPYDLSIDIRSALENIPAIGAGNVEVSRTEMRPVWHMNIELTGESRNEIQELSVTNLLGWLGQFLGEGRMILSYRQSDTEPISFEANAAEIQAALEELPQIGKGNVEVTKVSEANGKFNVEFKGLLASRDVDLIQVRAYEKNATDFFGGGITGNLLTTYRTKTIQNGRRAILDGRMMDTLTQKITDFYGIFDRKLDIDLQFIIKNNTTFTVIARSRQGYSDVDLATFDVLFNGSMLFNYLDNHILLEDAIESVTVDQYWNHRYTVEFVNEQANKPHPRIVGNAEDLTSSITITPVTPEVKVTYIEVGRAPVTYWNFDIEDDTASLKVESEEVNTIGNRTPWHLVFLPDGEEAGGTLVARGKVQVQQ